MRSTAFIPILVILSLVGAGRPGGAEPLPPLPEPRPSLELWTGAAPLFGLDRMLRGARAELGLGFRDSAFLPAVSLNLSWDQSLGVWVAEGLFGLGLGPGLSFHGGLLFPLAGASLDAGAGRTFALEPAATPGLFGFDAEFAGLELGSAGLRLTARAFFDYRAWRIGTARQGAVSSPLRREDALAVFSAGISAGLGLRLSWAPGSRKNVGPRRPKRRFPAGSSNTSSA